VSRQPPSRGHSQARRASFQKFLPYRSKFRFQSLQHHSLPTSEIPLQVFLSIERGRGRGYGNQQDHQGVQKLSKLPYRDPIEDKRRNRGYSLLSCEKRRWGATSDRSPSARR